MPAQHHQKLLKNNITTYIKAPPTLANSMSLEVKQIANNLKLADRI